MATAHKCIIDQLWTQLLVLIVHLPKEGVIDDFAGGYALIWIDREALWENADQVFWGVLLVLHKLISPFCSTDLLIDLWLLRLLGNEKWRDTCDHVEDNAADDPHVYLLAIVASRIFQWVDCWQKLWRRHEVVKLRNELPLALEGAAWRNECFLKEEWWLFFNLFDGIGQE